MVEICFICGASVKNLKEHINRNHREDLFECSECKSRFKRRDSLKRHIQRCHHADVNNQKTCTRKNLHAIKRRNRVRDVKDGNILHVPVFECEMCNKKYSRKDVLKQHCTNVHHIGVNEVQLYECDYCSKVFHYKHTLKSHILLCQSRSKVQSDNLQKTKLYTCLVSSCQITCNDRYSIMKHYQRDHNIQLIWECLEFGTRKEFDEWLMSLQMKSMCQFRTIVKWKTSTSYNQKFGCHRSGIPPVQKERVRFEKLTGSKKLGGLCPAEITVKESKMDKICKVTMQKIHVGHSPGSEEELAFISLDKNLKEEIIDKLAVGIPQDIVLMQYQSSVSSASTKKYRKMKSIRPQITQKLKVLHNRHHKAVKANGKYTVHPFQSQDEESACAHTWLISSFHNKEISYAEVENADGKNEEIEKVEDNHGDRHMQKKKKKNVNKLHDHYEVENDDEINMYIVQRNINVDLHTSSSSLKCTLCGIAFSEYSCTCIDYRIKNNMCKHIHAVVMHCKDTNTQCECSSQIVNMTERQIENFKNDRPTDTMSSQVLEEEEEVVEVKRRISAMLKNMEDKKKLLNIEKFVFTLGQQAFLNKEKSKGKNVKQKRIFSK